MSGGRAFSLRTYLERMVLRRLCSLTSGRAYFLSRCVIEVEYHETDASRCSDVVGLTISCSQWHLAWFLEGGPDFQKLGNRILLRRVKLRDNHTRDKHLSSKNCVGKNCVEKRQA